MTTERAPRPHRYNGPKVKAPVNMRAAYITGEFCKTCGGVRMSHSRWWWWLPSQQPHRRWVITVHTEPRTDETGASS